MKIFTRLFLVSFLLVTRLGLAATYDVQVTSNHKETKLQASLEAYPNPTRGEITIRLNQSGGENYKIRISNAIGRVVKTVDVPENMVDGISIDLSSLPDGLYFYSLLANEKMMETKRLIVQH